jgi:hypothetical protein
MTQAQAGKMTLRYPPHTGDGSGAGRISERRIGARGRGNHPSELVEAITNIVYRLKGCSNAALEGPLSTTRLAPEVRALARNRTHRCDPYFCNLFLEANIMNRSLVKAYGPNLPVVLAKIFGPPPLVGNEDPQLYKELFSHIADEYEPKTISDWLLVKDLADLHWDRLRERRLKPEVLKICFEKSDEESKQPRFVISAQDARV